jgi:hypothetical protein
LGSCRASFPKCVKNLTWSNNGKANVGNHGDKLRAY